MPAAGGEASHPPARAPASPAARFPAGSPSHGPEGRIAAREWRLGHGRSLRLDSAVVMAMLNVTPDSFSDGGSLPTPESAAEAAREAVSNGADMLDVGGESTRPGSASTPAEEQIRRVAPAVEAIRRAGVGVAISVDTTLAAVASAALDAGADAVNDQSAGRDDPGMLALVAARGAGLILMHRLRPPRDDVYSDRHATAPVYMGGVTATVREFLAERARAALGAGVDRESIALDPGLGFGKTVEQCLDLIAATDEFVRLGYPVVSAASRKSFLGRLSGEQRPAGRVTESVAASVAQRLGGAVIFRVHDVAAHARALRVADGVMRAARAEPTAGP